MSSENQVVENKISRLVAAVLHQQPGSIQPDTPLFSSQSNFDSFALMELVLRLEETFGLSIPDEDLDPQIFESIQEIVVYIRGRLEA